MSTTTDVKPGKSSDDNADRPRIDRLVFIEALDTTLPLLKIGNLSHYEKDSLS